PGVRHDYAGYIAWRGLVGEAALPEAVLGELRDYLSFSLPQGEQMLGYLVAGPGENLSPGQRTFNWVWYRPAHAHDALPELLTDDRGNRYEMSIPPDRIRRAAIDAMREAADRGLSPQYRSGVELTAQPFIQPIYDLVSPRLVHGRVLILGDAAFVARPHVGLGVTKAALDAAALSRAFGARDIDAALADWERERLAFGNAVVTRARELGAYLQAQLLTAAEREQAERNRSAEVIMRQTASPQALLLAAVTH
ncbi:MAG: FAD-dependent monooxygenase, partial [Gammaproteobacteria bacterium]